MTKGVQFRRGTSGQAAVFLGAQGEIIVDTDKKIAVVHDGNKVSGYELVGVAVTQTLSNKIFSGITTFNDVSVSGGVNVSGVSTFTSVQSSSISVTGMSTLAHTQVNNLNISGIVTATNTTINGTLFASGISTLGNTQVPNLYVSGISTFAQGINVTGVVTTTGGGFVGAGTYLTDLNASSLSTGIVPSARITAAAGDFNVGNNLYVSGSLSIGGTTAILNAAQLQVKDKDIVVGYTTDALNNDVSTDDTANHGGISVASTVGTPILTLPLQIGINSNPSTYKQWMWIKQNNYSGMGTDAWVSNYGVSIGNTASVLNGSYLTVGAGFTFGNGFFNCNDERVNNNFSALGISTFGSNGFVTLAGSNNISGVATFTGNTFFKTGFSTFVDSTTVFVDDGDNTRKMQFQLSGITAGNTRTITVPDQNTTLPIASQQLTFNGPTVARTYTLPDANVTIVSTSDSGTVTNGMLAGSIAAGKLTLNSANIIVGNASNVGAAVAMSGDITIDNTGATTIGATKVTNGMLAGSIALTKLLSDTTTALGVGSIELGNASDTTLARSAAGAVTIEGVTIATSSNTLTLTNKTLQPAAGTATAGTAPLKFTSGTNLGTPEAGAVEYDGSFLYQTPNTTSGRAYIPPYYTFRRTSNGAAIGAAIADFFTTPSSLSLEASSAYKISCFAYYLKTTAGTATWTHTFSSAPTVFEAILAYSPVTGIANGTQTFVISNSAGQATASMAHAATASLTTGVNHFAQFEIFVVTNAAANWRLQLTQSAGTATPLAGSFYTVEKIGTSTGTFVA
jgi:hypothetical protein